MNQVTDASGFLGEVTVTFDEHAEHKIKQLYFKCNTFPQETREGRLNAHKDLALLHAVSCCIDGITFIGPLCDTFLDQTREVSIERIDMSIDEVIANIGLWLAK